MCVTGNPHEPTFGIPFGQPETESLHETQQPVRTATLMPFVYGRHTPSSNMVVEASSGSSAYLALHQFPHGLLTQTQPFADGYEHSLYQSAENVDGDLPLVAQNFDPPPANGYDVSTHGDMSLGLPNFGGFFRCAIYQGGSAHLTTNISPAFSQVSYTYLCAEVRRRSVCKAIWG